MGYSDVQKEVTQVVTDSLETTGDKLALGFKRPGVVLGWGLTCTVLRGSPATDPVLALDHDPAGAGARVEKDSFTLADATALGTTIERSELMRGRSPVAPNAAFSAFDVIEGDLVFIEVTTAETAATAGAVVFYILWAPKGAP